MRNIWAHSPLKEITSNWGTVSTENFTMNLTEYVKTIAKTVPDGVGLLVNTYLIYIQYVKIHEGGKLSCQETWCYASEVFLQNGE